MYSTKSTAHLYAKFFFSYTHQHRDRKHTLGENLVWVPMVNTHTKETRGFLKQKDLVVVGAGALTADLSSPSC
jgi:hypothetical protein